MQLVIKEVESGKWIVLDADGVEYGPSCATQTEAEKLKFEWEVYYES